MAASAWLDETYVTNVTGVASGSAVGKLDMAYSVIELVTNRDLSVPTVFTANDQRNIKYAMAYQTAYLVNNPAVMTDIQVASSAVSDVSVSFESREVAGAHWLSPLARSALRKVSWRRNRSLVVARLNDMITDPLSDFSDDRMTWTPVK